MERLEQPLNLARTDRRTAIGYSQDRTPRIGATLLLGLGAVALLVGAIGIANIMVISVLERRGEIGLRRALGATAGTSASSS